jgi:hypothetical protein
MDLPDWVARRSLALRQPWRRPPLEVPGRPRASPGCTARETTDWSAISPFTRMVSGSASVVLAATTFCERQVQARLVCLPPMLRRVDVSPHQDDAGAWLTSFHGGRAGPRGTEGRSRWPSRQGSRT